MIGLIQIMRWSLTVMLLLIASTASSTPWSSQAQSLRKEVVMGVSNGIVSAPINPQEVYNLLGVAKYNDWWDIGYLCSNKHGKINPCSKFKPVKYRNLDSIANYWKATDEKCGFLFPSTTTKIMRQTDDGVWVYDPPTGGDASPFRLTDFEGYKHNAARKWLSISIPSTTTIGYNVNLTIVGTIILENNSHLTYYDTLSKLYLSVSPKTSTTLEAKKELPMADAKTTGGNFRMTIPGSDIMYAGAVPGSVLLFHLYGEDKNGNTVSVRCDSSIQTLWECTMVSTDAYQALIRCQAVLRNKNSDYEMRIYNLSLVLDAGYYSGGTLPANSRVRMYKYVSDSYNYIAYGVYMYEKYLPAMTVEAGKANTYQIGYPDMEIIYVDDPDFTQAMFIWQKDSGAELARLKVAVHTMAFN